MTITREHIYELLSEVKDPEIPVLSLIDLGVISEVLISESKVSIEMTPTFVGCPALDVMKTDIREILLANGISDVVIDVSFRKPWTSDNITEKGKAALKHFGLAPPPASRHLFADLEILETATCPRCDGKNTVLRSPFGATLCRAIYHCNDCRESFEQFKAL